VLAVVIVVGIIALTPVADWVKVPQPVLLTIFGLVIALVTPANPLSLDPALILPVVLPPLLFAATQRTTVNEFREHAGAVFVLAVGLTLATVVVVAVVAHGAGLPWAVSWVLGAMVSPPDPVAATAVARRLRLPHRLVTILEGEGMFNDATALVAYKVAIVAAVTGDITGGDIALELLEAVGFGLLVGFVLGYVSRVVLSRIHDGYAETTVTVLVPFVAYVGAEHINGSGVLAVLVLGLYLRTFAHDATTSGGWLLGRAVWSYADFLITSLVFALLGFELVAVIRSTSTSTGTAGLAVLVVATLVVFRAVWIFPAAWLARLRARRRDVPVPTG
jgi:monovalent cation/hydrogen antiporter